MEDMQSTSATSSQPFTWALTIATYKRELVLPVCLRLAAEQTYPPCEIIVCDASPYWEKTRDSILKELAPNYPNIRWIYIPAKRGSAAFQRNQAIQESTADAVFVFDDDTLMYPDCAARIMEVYNADQERVIKGVQAMAMATVPNDAVISEPKRDWEKPPAKPSGLKQILKVLPLKPPQSLNRFIGQQILLHNPNNLFLTYASNTFPVHELPKTVERLPVKPIYLMVGFKMTFRRTTIAEEGFEPACISAGTEDHDASYRVSLHGPLVEAQTAKVHHYQSASGRDAMTKRVAISIVHQAICIKRHAPQLSRAMGRFRTLMLRRLIASGLADFRSERWSFPLVKGVTKGRHYASKVFALPDHELEERCIQLQQELLSQG